MSKKCIDLYFEATLKDKLVDFLLEEEISDFYYFDCSGYSSVSLLKNDEERVAARRKFGMFRFFVSGDELGALSPKLAASFKKGMLKVFCADTEEIVG